MIKAMTAIKLLLSAFICFAPFPVGFCLSWIALPSGCSVECLEEKTIQRNVKARGELFT
jgi:hypothetical protein